MMLSGCPDVAQLRRLLDEESAADAIIRTTEPCTTERGAAVDRKFRAQRMIEFTLMGHRRAIIETLEREARHGG